MPTLRRVIRSDGNLAHMMVLATLVLVVANGTGCAAEYLPEELGWYVVDGGESLRLTRTEKLLEAGSLGHVVYALGAGDLSEVIVRDPGAHFIVHAVDAADFIENLELTRLVFTGSRDVQDPNLPPAFQRRAPVRFEAYTAGGTVAIAVVPAPSNLRMFKIIPREPLTKGVYALHRGDLEGSPFNRPVVYAFQVVDRECDGGLAGRWISTDLAGPWYRGVESVICSFTVDEVYACTARRTGKATAERGRFQTDGDSIRFERTSEESAVVSWVDHYSLKDEVLVLHDGQSSSSGRFRRAYP